MTVLYLAVAMVCKIIAITLLFRSIRSIRRKPHYTETYRDETL